MTLTPTHFIFLGVGLLIGILATRLIFKPQPLSPDNESFWRHVFKTNTDLDSTLGIFAFVWIITIMVFFFQDSLKDATEVGYIILAATNGLSGIVGVKHGAKMERSRAEDK